VGLEAAQRASRGIRVRHRCPNERIAARCVHSLTTQLLTQSGWPSAEQRVRLPRIGAEVLNEGNADSVGHVVVAFTQTTIDEGQQPISHVALTLVEGAHRQPQLSLISRCRRSSPPLSARCSSVTRLPPDLGLQLVNEPGASDHRTQHAAQVLTVPLRWSSRIGWPSTTTCARIGLTE